MKTKRLSFKDFDPIESKKNKKPKNNTKHDPARKNKKYFMQNHNDTL